MLLIRKVTVLCQVTVFHLISCMFPLNIKTYNEYIQTFINLLVSTLMDCRCDIIYNEKKKLQWVLSIDLFGQCLSLNDTMDKVKVLLCWSQFNPYKQLSYRNKFFVISMSRVFVKSDTIRDRFLDNSQNKTKTSSLVRRYVLLWHNQTFFISIFDWEVI